MSTHILVVVAGSLLCVTCMQFISAGALVKALFAVALKQVCLCTCSVPAYSECTGLLVRKQVCLCTIISSVPAYS